MRRHTLLIFLCVSHHFNPRTPAKECDGKKIALRDSSKIISIHAPPRRSATAALAGRGPLLRHFNPRTPAKECDVVVVVSNPTIWYFNPRTPAKECDSFRICFNRPPNDFNPRTPAKECDSSLTSRAS